MIESQLKRARNIKKDFEQLLKVRSSMSEAIEKLKNNYDPSTIVRMGDDKEPTLADLLKSMNSGFEKTNGKINTITERVGTLEVNNMTVINRKKLEPANPAIQPGRNEELMQMKLQEQAAKSSTPTPGQFKTTSDVAQEIQDASPWNEEEEQNEDEQEQEPWKLVVRGLSKSTRKVLPYLKEDEENLRLGGYQPTIQEINRYNRMRTGVVREIESTVKHYDGMEGQGFPSRSAYGKHTNNKKMETIRNIGTKLEGIKNPATRRVDRWMKESIEDHDWNVFVNIKLYQDLQQTLNRDPPQNIKTIKEQKIYKYINLMKREVIVGPFRQEEWAREDEKVGGMKNRPSYMMKMLCNHLMWFLDIPEKQLNHLKVVSIKPKEDSLGNLYPSQLRVTFMEKEMADLLLMHHSQNEARFFKKASTCKIMVADEFETRYRQLAHVAALKRNTFNAKSRNNAKMFTFITYSTQSLEIVCMRTTNRGPEWTLMKTPPSISASMWVDTFDTRRGTRLEPFQRRILERKDSRKIDFGGRVCGKWVMPVIQPAPEPTAQTVRTSSTMNASSINNDLKSDQNKRRRTEEHGSDQESEQEQEYDDGNNKRLVVAIMRYDNDDSRQQTLNVSLMQPHGSQLSPTWSEDNLQPSTLEEPILPQYNVEISLLSDYSNLCTSENPDYSYSSPISLCDIINADLDNQTDQDNENFANVVVSEGGGYMLPPVSWCSNPPPEPVSRSLMIDVNNMEQFA